MKTLTLLAIGSIFLPAGLFQDPTAEEKAAIFRRLYSPDPDVRASAARAAGCLELEQACPRLLELLGDSEYTVALAAASALEDMEYKGDPDDLLRRVQDGSVEFGAADELLAAWCGNSQVPEILKAVQDEKCKWRSGALRLLADLKSLAAVPAVMSWIDDSDHPLRKEAAWHLAILDVKEAIPKLRRWAVSSESHECLPAIRTLVELRAQDTGPDVLQIVREGDEIHRITHSCGFSVGNEYRDYSKLLKWTQPRLIVPTLESWLTDTKLQAHALRFLADIGHSASSPKIAILLKDKSPDVRDSAIYALGRLKAKEHLESLLVFVDDPDSDLRAAAAFALGRIGGAVSLARIRRLTRDPSEAVRASALEAVADADPSGCGPEIVRALEESDPEIVRKAIWLARSLKIKDAGPGIARFVGDEHFTEESVKALLALRATHQAEEVMRRLERLERFKRQDAAAVACSLGSRAAGAFLLAEAIRGERVSLAPLNALRAPAMWEKAVAISVGRETVSISQLLQEAASLSGTVFNRPTGPDRRLRRWLDSTHEWGWTSLDEILCFWDDGCGVLLEPEGIRLVTRAESIKFWQQWFPGTQR